VLPDSAHLQEEDARRANRRGYTKHAPALPLYTSLDAARTLTRLQPVGYDRPVPVVPGVEVEFVNAGHLLGSAYAKLHVGGRTILFGGDLGRYNRPVLPDPQPVSAADVLLVESTYGDRAHPPDDDGAALAAIINDAAKRGGKVIVPSFAIGRTEEVIYWIKRLEEQKRIPVLPVYVDSPMAAGALQFYAERLNELDPELNHGNAGQRQVGVFYTTRMRIVETVEQSKGVMQSAEPSIVIAASGMATGGRVLHHLAAGLPDPRNTVMFVGFQAAGTRGRLLCDGAKQIKMLGEVVSVAARIERVDSMSAHADANEILRWLKGFTKPPQTTYIVHGEPPAAEALAKRIQTELQWSTHVAKHFERVDLNI